MLSRKQFLDQDLIYERILAIQKLIKETKEKGLPITNSMLY